jgi:HK97 family phage portal protein
MSVREVLGDAIGSMRRMVRTALTKMVHGLSSSVLWLLVRPNKWYSGITLTKGILADRMLNGITYVIKVRSELENVVELWWAPSFTIQPISEGDDFITYYRYTAPGHAPMDLRFEDVIRLPDGMDAHDPRKGNSPMRSLLREVMTDDEAGDLTAHLMSNLGIPGVILSPKEGKIPPEVGDSIKRNFVEKTTGEHRGEPLVLERNMVVDQLGFSPNDMNMRDLRGIPEERITAVLGVNAAVVGLGAGLSTTKVGATLKEYREEAFESTIIPLYREISTELTNQLLDDFLPIAQWRLWYDLTQVRVLQEDENAKSERVTKQFQSGLITRAMGKRLLGYPITPDDEIYVLSRSLLVIPVGTSPEEQRQQQLAAPQSTGRNPSALVDEQIRALLEAREEVAA